MTEIETQDLVDDVNKQLSKLGWIINPFNTTVKQMDELTEILKDPLEEKIYLTLNDSVVAFSYRFPSLWYGRHILTRAALMIHQSC